MYHLRNPSVSWLNIFGLVFAVSGLNRIDIVELMECVGFIYLWLIEKQLFMHLPSQLLRNSASRWLDVILQTVWRHIQVAILL